MEIELVLRVAGVGMIVAVVCHLLGRAGREDHSMLVSLSGIIIIFIMLAGKLGELIEKLRGVFGL